MRTREPGTFLGHPVGLFVLFFTEMWERFSYYGMRALLVLYMVQYFKWTQEEASSAYKWYTSLVYLTPLIGGFIADRYIGNKWAIIIGAISMAIGHFCMAFEELWIFMAALTFLIVGNGFFKPNMSAQVGRLYPQNDPRRDGAYTIFYMGINLGAFLSPLVCGALKDTPGLGFHWGFAAAGVGMVLGLLTYLIGLPWVKELPPDVVYEGPVIHAHKAGHSHGESHALTEDETRRTHSVTPRLNTAAPNLILCLGLGLLLAAPALYFLKVIKWSDSIIVVIAAIAAFFASWIVSRVNMATRDRVLAIYAVFVFVVFFWVAFEQAGNAMNIWADQSTNRYLTEAPPAPALYPSAPVDIAEKGWWPTLQDAFGTLLKFNPVLTTSFQSINALAIVVLAPLFAWLWTFLAKRQVNLSIPVKMSIGVFMQGMAFALMIWSVKYEDGPSSAKLPSLPENFVTKDGKLHFFDAPNLGADEAITKFEQGVREESKNQPMIAHGGRLTYDAGATNIQMRGVLDENHRDRMMRSTAPKEYVRAIWDLAKESKKAKEEATKKGEESFVVEKKLTQLPAGFEPRYLSGFATKDVRFDAATSTLYVSTVLADKDYKQILLAGSNPEFRTAMNELYLNGAKYRVSSWWLFWFYILCTIGELCLSPVGLSMVSKLAPKQFVTMLMGIWLLASTFGHFIAGFLGENWEVYEPRNYFATITIGMTVASIVCFVIARKITAMMHGVR